MSEVAAVIGMSKKKAGTRNTTKQEIIKFG